MEAPKDDVAQEHFMILLDTLESNGFIHELSILANRITSQKITRLLVGKKIYGYWTFGARL
jgi:oxygen-independent coproporphyrinogen-3 oxidase